MPLIQIVSLSVLCPFERCGKSSCNGHSEGFLSPVGMTILPKVYDIVIIALNKGESQAMRRWGTIGLTIVWLCLISAASSAWAECVQGDIAGTWQVYVTNPKNEAFGTRCLMKFNGKSALLSGTCVEGDGHRRRQTAAADGVGPSQQVHIPRVSHKSSVSSGAIIVFLKAKRAL